MEETILCKKLIFQLPTQKPVTILGIIIKEDERYVRFRTENKSYCFHKDTILLITDTNIPFIGDTGDLE